MFDNKTILITGGTGSFGHKFVELMLQRHRPRRLIVFSRDELKQYEMRERFPEERHRCMRYFIGDVRDRERLYRAFDRVDIVVHAAALKQVPACEYNPMEAVRTNILGASNVIDAAIDRRVQQVIALSTDKAANPINLYGATKLCSDKLFIAGNSYSGEHQTRFSVVRYGNVVGSRGSVIPLFMQRRRSGVIPITDARMTRFWITLHQGVEFVMASLQRMNGGEVFVPKLPSMNIMDLADAIAPDCRKDIVGIRSGEKIHEVMIPGDESRLTLEYDDYYAICPVRRSWPVDQRPQSDPGRPCADGFTYSSDENPQTLAVEELRELVKEFETD